MLFSDISKTKKKLSQKYENGKFVTLSNYFLEQTSSRSGDPVENDTDTVRLSLSKSAPHFKLLLINTL